MKASQSWSQFEDKQKQLLPLAAGQGAARGADQPSNCDKFVKRNQNVKKNKHNLTATALGNGDAFGIQVAGLPGRWFTGLAVAPAIAQATPEVAASSLGAIGDSALVDLLGFGAMTTLAVPRGPAAFLAAWPLEADTPNTLLGHAHPGFALTRPRLTVNTSRVLSSGRQPLISLGVLDKAGQRGRLDAGYFRVPLELFSNAKASLTHAP